MIPLANSNEIFKQSFREDMSVGGSSCNEPRKLTIPEGPKLKTTRKYGEKELGDDSSIASGTWEAGLRSPSKSQRDDHPKLTIAKTPHFQPIRKRELPKSTAEKEKEEMEYFNSHPFKARPVRMHDRPPTSLSKKPVEKRKLTTPEPFHFNTDKRAAHLSEEKPKSRTAPRPVRPTTSHADGPPKRGGGGL